MAESPDFTWLVQQRSLIQELLLKLHQFGSRSADRLTDDFTRNIFHLLVGAAFSLWRAVFLIEPETSTQQSVDHSVTFLELLVRDNTINYSQDRNTRAWTAGYYLNGAYYRLAEVVAHFDSRPEFAAQNSRPFDAFRTADRRELVSSDRREACRIGYAAAQEAFLKLKDLIGNVQNFGD